MSGSLFTRLQELAEKATPGPWRTHAQNVDEGVRAGISSATGPGWVDWICEEMGQPEETFPNAALIVALRNGWEVIADALQAAQTVSDNLGYCIACGADRIRNDHTDNCPLAAVFSAGQDTGAGIAQSPDGDVRGGGRR